MLQKIEISEIHSFLSGISAIQFLKDCHEHHLPMPDLILLDVNMPIMDGFDFLEACRKLNLPELGNVHVIIVTTSDDADDIRKAKMMGASGYLTKPVSIDKFRKVLDVLSHRGITWDRQ